VKFSHKETRDSMLLYGENTESLSHPGLTRYRVVTEGRTGRQTDRITIAIVRALASTPIRAVARIISAETSRTAQTSAENGAAT